MIINGALLNNFTLVFIIHNEFLKKEFNTTHLLHVTIHSAYLGQNFILDDIVLLVSLYIISKLVTFYVTCRYLHTYSNDLAIIRTLVIELDVEIHKVGQSLSICIVNT